MSDAKHTQGRFYAEQTASSTFVTRAIYAERQNGSDVLVAHVGVPGPAENRPSVHEDVANADLFAAAPDMLAALQGVAEQQSGADFADGTVALILTDTQWAAVIAAIAKAKGKL